MSRAGWWLRSLKRLLKSEDAATCGARCDTAGGAPHRDLLGKRRGLLRKDWLGETSLKRALEYAINDFKRNYDRYEQICQQN